MSDEPSIEIRLPVRTQESEGIICTVTPDGIELSGWYDGFVPIVVDPITWDALDAARRVVTDPLARFYICTCGIVDLRSEGWQDICNDGPTRHSFGGEPCRPKADDLRTCRCGMPPLHTVGQHSLFAATRRPTEPS